MLAFANDLAHIRVVWAKKLQSLPARNLDH